MDAKRRQIAILGSTGSIGTQALDVISRHSDRFEAYALVANNRVELLIEQARLFMPEVVVIANELKYQQLKEALSDLPIKVWSGADAISELMEDQNIDMVLTAMVGFSGLIPTLSAIEAGKAVALANKESLVVAGDLIGRLALKHKAAILPVDSELSAIFQCLNGEGNNRIDKVLLTASGGPFRTFSAEQLKNVTKAEALKHPRWSMGEKVTVDSATLINKGFEMIEVNRLFAVSPLQIEVLIHPESIIHSMVQFQDCSIMAQLGEPDMRVPIQYAFSYPERLVADVKEVDFFALSKLTFEKPDMEKFPNLQFAYEAIKAGGNMPTVLNAANEVAVSLFLQERIGFYQISSVIERVMQKASFVERATLNDYIESDREARELAYQLHS